MCKLPTRYQTSEDISSKYHEYDDVFYLNSYICIILLKS